MQLQARARGEGRDTRRKNLCTCIIKSGKPLCYFTFVYMMSMMKMWSKSNKGVMEGIIAFVDVRDLPRSYVISNNKTKRVSGARRGQCTLCQLVLSQLQMSSSCLD